MDKVKVNATKKEILEVLDEASKENKVLSEENEALQDKFTELEEKMQTREDMFMQQMQQMQIMMQQMQMNNQVQQPLSTIEETVTLISHVVGKTSISIDGTSANHVTFAHSESEEDVTVGDVQTLLKIGNNKKLFANGIIEFADEKNYSRFKIKPKKILTNDYIKDLFQLGRKDMLIELKDITNNKKNDIVVHNILYRAGILYKREELGQVSYEAMETFKEFFGYGILELNLWLLPEEVGEDE